LGKNLNKHHLNKHKKEGLAIYVGYTHQTYHIHSWEEFQMAYSRYLLFWHQWQSHNPQTLLPQETTEISHFDTDFFAQKTNALLPVIHQAFLTKFQQPIVTQPKTQIFRLKWLLVACVFALLGAGAVYQNIPQKKKTSLKAGKAKIHIVKRVAGENISTVWVAYDVRGLGLDSVLVSSKYADTYPKYYATNKPVDTLSFIFNKPGGAITLSNGSTELVRTGFYQQTTGWIGWMYSGDFTGPCHQAHQIQKNGVFSYDSEMIPQKYKDYYFTMLLNQQDFKVKGNDMTLETRIKLIHKPIEATCNELNIQFADDSHNSKTTFDLKGCEYWTGLNMGETEIAPPRKNLATQQTQLTPFTHSLDSLQQWNTVKIRIKNQKAFYYWNNREIFVMPFKGNIGSIKRLSFLGKGSWAIDWVCLKNGDNQIVYYEGFDK